MSIIRSLVVLALLASPALRADEALRADKSADWDDVFNSDVTLEQTDEIISRMTLPQKIGQLFLLGFTGTEFDQQLKPLIERYQPGGIILFSRNIKTASQVLTLNIAAQKYAVEKMKIPLVIAVDQEGGTVSRIKSSPPQPSALAIGNAQSTELSEKIGFYTGKVLKSLGFNLNLAPVVDIADPNSPSFLGTRAFSGNADLVSKFSFAFASGLHKSGVMATLKHFPGHGNEKTDPHFRIPEISDDLQTLENTRLKPFKYLVDQFQPAAIMVAHLAIPKVDPKAKAATYSSVLIQDILRKKWGYEGLVITDDIDMAAAQEIANPANQAVRALKAGVDMVMITWNKKTQRESFEAVKRALLDGTLTISEINEKLRRIVSAKLNFHLFDKSLMTFQDARLALHDPNLKRAYDGVTQQNLKANVARLPASAPFKGGKVVVMSRSKFFMDSFTGKLSPKCCLQQSLLDMEDINRTLNEQKDALAVIHVSGLTTANIVNKIRSTLRHRVIVVNTNSPSLVLAPETYARTINLFTYHPELGGLIAEKVLRPFSTNKQIHGE
jgi:beta-N-acetylhexosaminidase